MKIELNPNAVKYGNLKAGDVWSYGILYGNNLYMKTDSGDVDLATGDTFTGDNKTPDNEIVYKRAARIVIAEVDA